MTLEKDLNEMMYKPQGYLRQECSKQMGQYVQSPEEEISSHTRRRARRPRRPMGTREEAVADGSEKLPEVEHVRLYRPKSGLGILL